VQVERLVEMSSTFAIKEWRRLPMIVSQVHVSLLQVLCQTTHAHYLHCLLTVLLVSPHHSGGVLLFVCLSVCLFILILLGLALCLLSGSVSSVFMVLHMYLKKFLLTSFSLPFSELSLVRLALDVVD